MTAPAWHRPASVDEAIALLSELGEDGSVVAGATAHTLLRKQGLVSPSAIVDLGAIDGLDGIVLTPDGGLAIGALATLRAVETSPIVRERAPMLAHAVGRVATVRIRNQATLGGNLAHADPAQDPPVILLALDAQVDVAGPDGRRRLPLEDFFVDVFETVLGPAELLTSIVVPPVPATSLVGYEKFLPRTADDYATVSVAARLDVEPDGAVRDARVALGSVASVPMRAAEAEALLRGSSRRDLPIDAVVEAVTAAVDPVDDVRGSAAYKREMAGLWTARLLRRLAAAPPVAA